LVPRVEINSTDGIEAYVAGGFGIGLSVAVPKAKMSPKVRLWLGTAGFCACAGGGLVAREASPRHCARCWMKCRREPGGCRMLYPRSNGGNIAGCLDRVSLAKLSYFFLRARLFRAQPALDAYTQVNNEHGQDDQPEFKIIEHDVRRPKNYSAKLRGWPDSKSRTTAFLFIRSNYAGCGWSASCFVGFLPEIQTAVMKTKPPSVLIRRRFSADLGSNL
jgi:hypothetical protein